MVRFWPGLAGPFARRHQLHAAQFQFSFSARDLPAHQPGFDAAHVVDQEMKVWLAAVCALVISEFCKFCQKSAIKRDGPVFFSSAPVKVAGDEKKIIAIVAPRQGEAPVLRSLGEGGSVPRWPTIPFLKK